jgi:signal transduction histidine kinase
MIMKVRLWANVVAATLLFSGSVLAAEYGTAEEARAMLDRVIVAMQADPVAALAKFNAGDAEFRDRDLYPFCVGPDGRTTAHADAAELGQPIHDLKDVDGKAFGEEILRVAEEGKINEVTYKRQRPGSQEPLPKVSFVTKIGDQTCGVGYYK